MIEATRHHWHIMIGGVAWVVLVASGFVVFGMYQSTPGSVGQEPRGWPIDSRICLAADRDTLVMFAHPRCPCTQASVAELGRIVSRCQGRLETRVLFYVPPGARSDWTNGSIWTAAAAIPGVQVFGDAGGKEAARFGAESSGHVLLFEPSGRLLFSGGITGLRGEEGDNLGRQAIITLVNDGQSDESRSLVFGCPIKDRPTP
jgi:hypothetical protein